MIRIIILAIRRKFHLNGMDEDEVKLILRAAPEVLEYGKYSVQSDVWSFGIVCDFNCFALLIC